MTHLKECMQRQLLKSPKLSFGLAKFQLPFSVLLKRVLLYQIRIGVENNEPVYDVSNCRHRMTFFAQNKLPHSQELYYTCALFRSTEFWFQLEQLRDPQANWNPSRFVYKYSIQQRSMHVNIHIILAFTLFPYTSISML